MGRLCWLSEGMLRCQLRWRGEFDAVGGSIRLLYIYTGHVLTDPGFSMES